VKEAATNVLNGYGRSGVDWPDDGGRREDPGGGCAGWLAGPAAVEPSPTSHGLSGINTPSGWVGRPVGERASAIDSRPREGSVSGQLPDQWGRHLRCLDVGHFVLLHICIFRQTTIAHINLPDLTLLSSSHRRDAMQRNGIIASFWAV